MKTYLCLVCGYDYDPAVGDPGAGIPPGTAFEDLPEDWVCPICGADKSMFQAEQPKATPSPLPAPSAKPESQAASSAMLLSAQLANLARGCEKQYLHEAAAWLNQLSTFYGDQAPAHGDLDSLQGHLQGDLDTAYPAAFATAKELGDRGALRALTWGEKVSRMQASLIKRLADKGEAQFEGDNIFVCEACGFIYLGEAAPDICPVCKVPAFKFTQIQRGA